MGDHLRITEERVSGDWSWIAARVFILLGISEYTPTPKADGVRITSSNSPRGIAITQEGDMTHISAWTEPGDEHFWDPILDDVVALARHAGRLHRASIGAQLKGVLDDYYQRRERGERVKLKDLAEAAGVKYGSLRQAKYRYDEQRRKNVIGD